jgi:hypothetical protein
VFPREEGYMDCQYGCNKVASESAALGLTGTTKGYHQRDKEFKAKNKRVEPI